MATAASFAASFAALAAALAASFAAFSASFAASFAAFSAALAASFAAFAAILAVSFAFALLAVFLTVTLAFAPFFGGAFSAVSFAALRAGLTTLADGALGATLPAVWAGVWLGAALVGALGVTLLAALTGAGFFSGAGFVATVFAGDAAVFVAVLAGVRADASFCLAVVREAGFAVSDATLPVVLAGVRAGVWLGAALVGALGVTLPTVLTGAGFFSGAVFAAVLTVFFVLASLAVFLTVTLASAPFFGGAFSAVSFAALRAGLTTLADGVLGAALPTVWAGVWLGAALVGVLGVTLLVALTGAGFFSGAGFVATVFAGDAAVFAAVLAVARADASFCLAVARDAGFTVSGATTLRADLSVDAFFTSPDVFAFVLRGVVCATVFTDFLRDAFFAVSIRLLLVLLSVAMDALLFCW
ncbi:MAG: hypothetical protein LBJ59_11075 [Zoogloeaceae bacterium]|nr:hypothetical protein [Zoogloeaceae bacterium]